MRLPSLSGMLVTLNACEKNPGFLPGVFFAGIECHKHAAETWQAHLQAVTHELVQARVLPIRRALTQGIICGD